MKKSHGPGHVLVFDCAYPLGTSCFSNQSVSREDTRDHGSIRKSLCSASAMSGLVMADAAHLLYVFHTGIAATAGDVQTVILYCERIANRDFV